MAIDHPKPSAQNTHRHVLWLDPSVGISPSRIRRVRICENCISFDLECLNQFCAFPPKLPYASKSLPVSWLLKDTAHFGTSTKIILEHQNLVMLEHQKNVFKKRTSIHQAPKFSPLFVKKCLSWTTFAARLTLNFSFVACLHVFAVFWSYTLQSCTILYDMICMSEYVWTEVSDFCISLQHVW